MAQIQHRHRNTYGIILQSRYLTNMWVLMNNIIYWLNLNFSCLSGSWLNMRHLGKPCLKTMSSICNCNIITFCLKITQELVILSSVISLKIPN